MKSEKNDIFYVHLKLFLGTMIKALKRRSFHFDVKKGEKISVLNEKERYTRLEIVSFCSLVIDKLSSKLIQGFFKHLVRGEKLF